MLLNVRLNFVGLPYFPFLKFRPRRKDIFLLLLFSDPFSDTQLSFFACSLSFVYDLRQSGQRDRIGTAVARMHAK